MLEPADSNGWVRVIRSHAGAYTSGFVPNGARAMHIWGILLTVHTYGNATGTNADPRCVYVLIVVCICMCMNAA